MKQLIVRIAVVSAVAALAGGCSQHTAPPTPTRPPQIVTVDDATQAIDYLAAVVEKQDYDAIIQTLAHRHGDSEGSAAILLGYGDDAAVWLRSRTLIVEREEYFVFELTSSGVFETYRIRVHKSTSTTEGSSDEGIEI